MKYLVDVNYYLNENFNFPQNGEKVYLKPPLPEYIPQSPSQIIDKTLYIVHTYNSQGNDAGFGWVWLWNKKNQTYDYRMSIFDRRTIPASQEVPYVGLTNESAYGFIHARKTFQSPKITLKVLFNELLSQLRRCFTKS